LAAKWELGSELGLGIQANPRFWSWIQLELVLDKVCSTIPRTRTVDHMQCIAEWRVNLATWSHFNPMMVALSLPSGWKQCNHNMTGNHILYKPDWFCYTGPLKILRLERQLVLRKFWQFQYHGAISLLVCGCYIGIDTKNFFRNSYPGTMSTNLVSKKNNLKLILFVQVVINHWMRVFKCVYATQ
jgi:hypothetical protein